MEPFSEKVNMVIGSNGQGKSNFLESIIFVLTDKYQNLRQEDKKKLLHEDITDNTHENQKIQVDLVFDNKDKKIPIDKDTITISKVYNIIENREEVFINKKRILKADMISLLESAGFTKTNPYYIIQQGKINALTHMNEGEYYEIFSEVTGSKAYDDKKKEAEDLYKKCNNAKNQIEKTQKEIGEYIQNLKIQSTELEEYMKLENERKAIELFILNENLNECQEKIDILEERKKIHFKEITKISNKINIFKIDLNDNLNKLNQCEKIHNNIKDKIAQCNNEIYELNQLQLSQDFHSNKEKNNQEISMDKEQLENQLNKLIESKSNFENELISLNEQLSTLTVNFKEKQEEYDLVKKRNESLYFKNDQEKMDYIINQNNIIIKMVNQLDSDKNNLLRNIINDNIKVKKQNDINQYELNIKELKSQIDSYENSFENCKKERKNNTNLLKRNEISLNEFQDDVGVLNEELNKIQVLFPSFEVFKECFNIKLNQEINNLTNVYGLFIDFIVVDDKAKNAVDLLLGNKLYSLVVDTAKTANSIFRIIEKHSGPVINCIPLEYYDSNEYTGINTNSQFSKFNNLNDAKPLINFVKLNEKYVNKINMSNENKIKMEIVIRKYINNCLLVKSYEIGMNLSKENKLICITGDNELIGSGGYMSKIGYYNQEKQRVNLYEKYVKKNDELIELNNKIQEYKKNKDNLIKNENEYIIKINEIGLEKDKLLRKIEEYNLKVNEYKKDINEIDENNKRYLQEVDGIMNKIDELNLKKESLYKLMNDYDSQSQSNNISNLREIETQLVSYSNELNSCANKVKECEANLNNINNQIESLNKSLDFIRENQNKKEKLNIDEFNIEEDRLKDIEIYKAELENYNKLLNNNMMKIDKFNQLINEIKSNNKKEKEKLNELECDLKRYNLNLTEQNEIKNNIINKIRDIGNVDPKETENLNKKKENLIKNLQNQSHLSISLNEEKLKFNITKPFYENLCKINESLKKYERINKYAKEDLEIFQNKLTESNDKLSELENNSNKFKGIISNYENKQNEALKNTFDNVNNSFKKFFKDLVPDGEGKLVLNLKEKKISISVKFKGIKELYSKSMEQLSGGQKTVVAVALIFALSKIEQPPFYILDEFDEALDPEYRKNLSNIIQELSIDNQFIISTFKPELIDIADNIYKIHFINKSSYVNLITKKAAQKFFDDFDIGNN